MVGILYLARANNLSSYDASYLDISIRKGVPLATLDKKLIEAAKNLNVPIYIGEMEKTKNAEFQLCL